VKGLKDLLLRLRAALTPPALIVLALLLLLCMNLMHKGDTGTALERRTAEALASISGAGEVQVVIRMREAQRQNGISSSNGTAALPCGAIAVAQGADDPWVKIELQEALCALLGLPPSAVSVVAGGE